jgi:tRNA A37 threonylcarbamoyltransferase TsaD
MSLRSYVLASFYLQVLCGGVAGNLAVRAYLTDACAAHRFSLLCVPPQHCTDNAIMIAQAGIEKWRARYSTGCALPCLSAWSFLFFFLLALLNVVHWCVTIEITSN